MNFIVLIVALAIALSEPSASFANTEHGYGLLKSKRFYNQVSPGPKGKSTARPELNEYAIAYGLEKENSKEQKSFEAIASEFEGRKPLAGALKKVVLGGAKMFWEDCWGKVTDKKTGKSVFSKPLGVLAYTTKEQCEGKDKCPITRIRVIDNPEKVKTFVEKSRKERAAHHENMFESTRLLAKGGWGNRQEIDKNGHVRFKGTFALTGGRAPYETATTVEIRGENPEKAIFRYEMIMTSGGGAQHKVLLFYCRI